MPRRDVLVTAVDRLVGAAECLGAVPVDTGDVRALAVIVGAQARVVEALARLDAAEDRRRTGRVQREVLRARLALMPGARLDAATGAVVVLPPLDQGDVRGMSTDALMAEIDRLAGRIRAEEAAEVSSLSARELEVGVIAGVRALLARSAQGDDDARALLARVIREGTAGAVELDAAE
jgi:hypothetical protein